MAHCRHCNKEIKVIDQANSTILVETYDEPSRHVFTVCKKCAEEIIKFIDKYSGN